jgi:iron complex transport system substrate-binding protein
MEGLSMIKRKLLFFILFGIILLITACGTTEVSNGDQKKNIYIDTLGREVEITAIPDRVISLTPAVTEIIFALGVDDKLVGVTSYCHYPEEAQDKPIMGDFLNPNLELVIDAEPDLVFVAAGVQKDLIDRMEELGITVLCLDAESIPQVIENISMTGEIMGVTEVAEEITKDMQMRVDNVTEAVKGREKPLVFFEVWDEPLMSAGPGSFIHSLIEMAGGVNLAADIENTDSWYPQLSIEILVEKNPDIYIANDFHKKGDIIQRPGYEAIKAIQNERVYTINDDLITLPGPRIILGLEQLAQIIHPDAFE